MRLAAGPTFASLTRSRSTRDRLTKRKQHEHHSQPEEGDCRGLLSGGVALAGLGLTAGTAQAAPQGPGPTIDHSDFGVPVVECIQCGRNLPGKLDIPSINPAGKVPVAVQGVG
jgi:hypothetical protein